MGDTDLHTNINNSNSNNMGDTDLHTNINNSNSNNMGDTDLHTNINNSNSNNMGDTDLHTNINNSNSNNMGDTDLHTNINNSNSNNMGDTDLHSNANNSNLKLLEQSELKTLEIYELNILENSELKTLEIYELKLLENSELKTLEISELNILENSELKTLEISELNILDKSELNKLEISELNILEISELNKLEISELNEHELSDLNQNSNNNCAKELNQNNQNNLEEISDYSNSFNAKFLKFGTFDQYATKFADQSRGNQCTCNCLVFLSLSTLNFDSNTLNLDYILNKGDEIYRKHVQELTTQGLFKNMLLNFDEIPIKIEIPEGTFIINKQNILFGLALQYQELTGFLTLQEAIQNCIKQSNKFLILIGAICSAVYYFNHTYYFFDTHSHSECTLNNPLDSSGKSILIGFADLHDLLSYLYGFYTSLQIDLDSQFEILPVCISSKDTDKDVTKQIKNYFDDQKLRNTKQKKFPTSI
ncbi:unnamed protein product [Mytilus edulis]|uniref:Peptidase C76 domain-containing protein n=2 Tax=Mytilus edulis TaxID=6550 RepID=A0A8S3S0A5_MYTED|nr:unnamed protein product [Mytilus edulis]